jgi:N-acyl-D-amino-acid deacylase
VAGLRSKRLWNSRRSASDRICCCAIALATFAGCGGPGGVSPRTTAPDYDIIFAAARVVDGTGAPWFRADVGVKGDRIAFVGDLANASAARKIDVRDHVIAPGFIDLLGQSEMNLLIDNRGESKIRQGITTELTGELYSAAPLRASFAPSVVSWFAIEQFKMSHEWTDFDGYFERLERAKTAMNLGSFVGVASVRAAVIGLDDVQPTPSQLAQMQGLVDTAMRQGAFGVSTSLGYPPARYAQTAELTALASISARHGGIYATHMRSYGKKYAQSLEEVFTIARTAHLPVEIWHLGLTDEEVWGHAADFLAAIEAARSEGLDITADAYPYDAGQNALDSQLPDWAHAGGVDQMIARFHEPSVRSRIIQDWTEGDSPDALTRYAHQTMVASCANPALQRYVGMRLDEIARAMGKPIGDALLDFIEQDHGNTTQVIFVKREDDVRAFMTAPWVALGVDSAAQAIDGPFAGFGTHPRAFGAAARLLGPYVRDLKLLSLEDAVRKMTSLPARRIGLTDRGILRPGMLADLVVFDPATIRDLATYTQPLQYAVGVEFVAVNGQLVLDSGKMTAARPGRALRHKP